MTDATPLGARAETLRVNSAQDGPQCVKSENTRHRGPHRGPRLAARYLPGTGQKKLNFFLPRCPTLPWKATEIRVVKPRTRNPHSRVASRPVAREREATNHESIRAHAEPGGFPCSPWSSPRLRWSISPTLST